MVDQIMKQFERTELQATVTAEVGELTKEAFKEGFNEGKSKGIAKGMIIGGITALGSFIVTYAILDRRVSEKNKNKKND